MADLSEAGRQAGHVWVDLVSSFDITAPELWQGAFTTALPRFSEVGAVKASFDDDTAVLDIEATNLLCSATVIIQYLASRVAHLEGVDRDDVLVRVREQLDS